jgi:hypothetical protein
LLELTAARVKGLGGDPEQIPPSLGGYRGKPHGRPDDHGGDHDRHRHVHPAIGKVAGVAYDRFGDFAGFRLITEHGHGRRYRAREAEIERLVVQAWRSRWVVEVIAHADDHDADDPPRAEAIILVRTGVGFED